MTKGWQQAGLIFFVLISAAGAFAADESITITTYYPSSYGDYKSLSTTSFTYLATTEGNVGIGTSGPGAQLELSRYAAVAVGPALKLRNTSPQPAAQMAIDFAIGILTDGSENRARILGHILSVGRGFLC
jgi:hypothetical protein